MESSAKEPALIVPGLTYIPGYVSRDDPSRLLAEVDAQPSQSLRDRPRKLPMIDPRLHILLLALEPAKGKRFWHGGPTLQGALRGVSARQALWRPTGARRCIWAHVLHGAYWKYAVRRRLVALIESVVSPSTSSPSEPAAFPRSPANWPRVPAKAQEKTWAADRTLLRTEHDNLLSVVNAIPLDHLFQIPPGAKSWTVAELIVGIAEHDTYHTAQVQLLKRLWKGRRS
ncbi:MAG: DinB family protein [Pyrinomonadaceae bacterium]|nr:DinB family protein [Phycisphaerales bacterium]